MDDDYKAKVRLIIAGVRRHGEASFRVEGESMAPVLKSGSTVKIQKIPFGLIRPTDWVAFVKAGRLVVHEVLFVARNYLVSWGVNNSFTDGRVDKKDVLGMVVKANFWRRWHLILLAEAKVVFDQLERLKVKNLILKGPPWQVAKFGYLFDKPVADIDWLIDAGQYQVVKKLLNKLGYRQKRETWVKNKFYRGAIPRVSEISFVKKVMGKDLTIDLHLLAIKSPLISWYKEPISYENMTNLSQYFLSRRVVTASSWPVLPDTDALLYLCLNIMFQHAGRGIYQLSQIATLIGRNRIDWDYLVRIARGKRLENYLYFPLLWVRKVGRLEIPILSDIRPSTTRVFLAKLAINRFTVGRPLRASSGLVSRLNELFMATYLRLVLSLGKEDRR